MLPAGRGGGHWLQKNTDCCCPRHCADEQNSSLWLRELPGGSVLVREKGIRGGKGPE